MQIAPQTIQNIERSVTIVILSSQHLARNIDYNNINTEYVSFPVCLLV